MTSLDNTKWLTYKRLLTFTRPAWWALALSIIGYIIYAAASTGLVEITEHMINLVAEQQTHLAYQVVLAILGVTFLRGIGTFLGKYYIGYVARTVVHQLRCQLFNKFLSLPKSFYDHNQSGKLIAQLTFDVELVTNACTDALTISLREGLFIIGLLSYLFYTNWQLTLTFLVTMPLVIIIVVTVSKRFRKLTNRIQLSIGNVSHIATEAINGFSVVRIFGGQQYESKRFKEVSHYNYKQSIKMIAADAISIPTIQFLVAIALALLVYLAMQPDWGGAVNVGEFTAFITAAGLLAKPLRQISEINVHIQKGIAAASRLFAQLDINEEPDTGTIKANRLKGDIEFNKVNFYFDKKHVLKDINLTIKAGSTVAIVGSSGSGKSTLINLLLRFYSASKGTIKIDNQDIAQYTLNSLRDNISIVEQKVTLFHDTIANNIAYGSLCSTSREQIIHAATQAHAIEFIEKLPQGLDTHIGEDGNILSGGQRQRLALARAFLKQAPILILDEATSALDSTTEKHIQDALEQLEANATTIIIAHRLSTIEHADTIVVMDGNGYIAETGNHHQLIQANGLYKKLYKNLSNNTDDNSVSI